MSTIWPFRFHRHPVQVQTHTHTRTGTHTRPSAGCVVRAVRSHVGNVQSHLAFRGSEISLGLGTATVCMLRGYMRFPSILRGVWCTGPVYLIPTLPDPFWRPPHTAWGRLSVEHHVNVVLVSFLEDNALVHSIFDSLHRLFLFLLSFASRRGTGRVPKQELLPLFYGGGTWSAKRSNDLLKVNVTVSVKRKNYAVTCWKQTIKRPLFNTIAIGRT